MQRAALISSIGLALATGALSPSVWAQSKSLYDRLGGKPAIEAVVKDFAGRALADARINQKFGRSDADRLTTMLVQQICAVSGGPCKYTGRSMKAAHQNMGVTEGEFGALVEDLTAALDHAKVAAAEKGELLTALGAMKGDIVEVKGNATGTPLPAAFKPWTKPPS